MEMELLAPAGDLEKLEIAAAYGADAVYVGVDKFSLREGANLTGGDLEQAVRLARAGGMKIYAAVNLLPRNKDLACLPHLLSYLAHLKVDAVIISDPGAIGLVEKYASLPWHLSTQANTTNWASALFWERQGARRLNLARELSIGEIREIRMRTGVELEIFVHGAMCLSYSGRCWLSMALAGRDGNAGDCAQPCRWNYRLQEETRPGIFMPVEEGRGYTALMSSKDLCLLAEIPALAEAGINSLKIEGRRKSGYYVAVTVKTYRKAIDAYLSGRWTDKTPRDLGRELDKISNRGYTKGFFISREEDMQSTGVNRAYDYVGLCRESGNVSLWEIKNGLEPGEAVEIISPLEPDRAMRIPLIYDSDGKIIPKAHAGYRIRMETPFPVAEYSIMIRKCR